MNVNANTRLQIHTHSLQYIQMLASFLILLMLIQLLWMRFWNPAENLAVMARKVTALIHNPGQ